jgi:hypothetical protein
MFGSPNFIEDKMPGKKGVFSWLRYIKIYLCTENFTIQVKANCPPFDFFFRGTEELRNNRSIAMDAKTFCTAFACALTVPCNEEGALIGRNGEESLFTILSKLQPQVRKPEG